MSIGRWRFLAATFLQVAFFIGSSLSEKAPYHTFAKDATLAPAKAYYDYIVIGGGTAGCALATTLSEGTKVLMLERGGLPYGNRNIMSINGYATTLLDTSPTSASQLFISTDGVFNHRARVLGGGTALNAGFYTRAEPDYIARSGWDPTLVRESYEWVEKQIVSRPPVLGWQSAVRDGLLEAGIGPDNGFTFEHLNGTKISGSTFEQNGRRHTAADLLEHANPSLITVHLHATVHQILFSTQGQRRPRACGVVYKDSKGNSHEALLNGGPKNEVILTAGTIASPQILMLSGIGPAQQLMAHGIKIILNQTMVGQGLSDNPMNAVLVPTIRPVETSLVQVVGITPFGSYIESTSGSAGLDWIHIFATIFDHQKSQTSQPFPVSTKFQAGIIAEKIMGPLSTGHLELQTRNPNDNPRVTFNYFEDPTDLERCVKGMQTIKRVIASKALSSFRYPFTTPESLMNSMLSSPVNLRKRHLSSTLSMEQFCKDTVMTIWHYHGGCQVGRVVDSNYRVIGVDALRVIDSSTFDESPGTNPQATVMMLGRYMGQRILRERASWGKRNA